MAHRAEQTDLPTSSSTESSSPSPESSLPWCLAQLTKPTPSADPSDHTRPESKPSKDADKRLKAGQWRALVAIRTHHIKGGSSRIAWYKAQGGLPPLLAILRRPESSRKILDLSLSILANCCTEKETRAEVRKLDGVSIVVEVLKRNASVETVENRAARTLGNLAMDPEGSTQVHSAGGVSPLLLCLSLSSSPSSPSSPSSSSSVLPPPPSSAKTERAQSAARALFYLSDSPNNRLALLSQGAFSTLAHFVAAEYPLGLRRASLRALHELTRGCGMECAREVAVSGVLTQLGLLASGEAGRALEDLALKILANLCSQGCMRPLVGSLGVVQRFAQEAKRDPLKSSASFKALCLCCKEAVNRAKVKESGGLEVLIGFLGAHRDHPMTRLAILACVDFVYDEAALEQLQELGLVPLLVARLVDLVREDEPKTGGELSPGSCFDSFDFPPPEGSRREEVGKEPGNSSFLSLRSWLLSEGLISSEGELLESPCGPESDFGSPHPSSSPSSFSSSSSSPPLSLVSEVPSPQPALLKPASSPSARTKPGRPAPPTPQSPTPPACAPTPQPRPQPGPASPFKAASPPRKRPRTSSSSSSSSSHLSLIYLDTPPVVPKTSTYQHPYHPEPWAPESPILLLLSRFSHAADPSGALVTAPVFSALLHYLTQHREPSGRCCRMLTRISSNQNCLQALVRTGAVALIRHRLCLGEEERAGKERQSERVKAKIRQLGQGLLNNVRVQSETAFGSGVLTHIVLSGSEADKLYCVLSLPLISSNRILLKKLLLDSGGLTAALDRLDCPDGGDEDDRADRCSSFFSAWSCPPEQASVSRSHALYASLLIGCLSALLAGSKVKPGADGPAETESSPGEPERDPRRRCPYQTSAHDLAFALDDGTLLPASREAVSGRAGVAEAESAYFRALLRGGFDEALSGAGEPVRIRDVTRGALLPALHYLHGCRTTPGGPDAAGRERCPVLSSLVPGGLGQLGGFERSPLAEAMIGASRFLVPGLQKVAEEMCVSLLRSSAQKLAPGVQKPDESAGHASLCPLLPRVYWFSQRYSYSRLGLACLSVLLRPQEAHFTPLPPSVSADCLLRLAREADSTEGLRKDLLGLATAALS
ncbi:armadillo repeat-containing protein 5 [Trichomycterus rosablanca]|uniref:armadillo repeat-containing protein 5 n=1 Tax=Trichomycterus rosablanca TaxID=2290929 RepID=UPI002F35CBE0